MSLLLFYPGKSRKFPNSAVAFVIALLGSAILIPFPALGSAVEPTAANGEQGLVTLELTTPTQVHFTIAALAGTYVTIRNNDSGEEFAILAEISASNLTKSEASEVQRQRPKRFNIRFFERIQTAEGSSWKQIALLEEVRAGQEVIEPVTGFVFEPKKFDSLKTNELKRFVDGEGIGIMCCVDCGGFSVCGARVSGCGMTCNNCESCIRTSNPTCQSAAKAN